MPDADLVLAIDIGGSKLRVGLVNRKGEILSHATRPLAPSSTGHEILALTEELRRDLAGRTPRSKPVAAGVAVPGLTDPRQGIWVYSSFSGIKDFRLGALLEDELKIPVTIGNDVNVCAFGERVFGSCQEVDDFIWITVSNGIGGGLVLDGRIYEGAFRNAGEIGHITVVEHGELCRCGKRGCLEAYASGASIARRYAERLRRDGGQSRAVSALEIAKAAKSGERLAREIYAETGQFLGRAIAHAVNLLNPGKVILGGGVAMDLELFQDELMGALHQMVFTQANRLLTVEKTALGYDAALLGAAAIAQERFGRDASCGRI